MSHTRESLERRLDEEQKSLHLIEEKIAKFTDLEAPIHLLKQRDDVKESIAQIEEQLRHIPPEPPLSAPSLPVAGRVANAKAQIFLCYAREDEEKVEELYQQLSDGGFNPWMDKKDIFPGERWKDRIPQAIRRSDFFLACVSTSSATKRGFIQREIRDALEIWREKLDSDIYLIPVRLEDCNVPESLDDFQWVDLFEEGGWTRLVEAIQEGMKRRAEVTKPTVQESTPFEPYLAHEKPSPDTAMATPEKGLERVRDRTEGVVIGDKAQVEQQKSLERELTQPPKPKPLLSEALSPRSQWRIYDNCLVIILLIAGVLAISLIGALGRHQYLAVVAPTYPYSYSYQNPRNCLEPDQH